MTNSEIKSISRRKLKGNLKRPILACLVIIAIEIVSILLQELLPKGNQGYLSFGFSVLLMPLAFGIIGFFITFIRDKNPEISSIFNGYKHFGKVILTNFLIGILTILWSFCFIIPGMIKSLSYSMTLYILNDNIELPIKNAINKSIKMMTGHKWKYLCLNFSFIGWILLSVITLGIGFIWIIPYISTASAVFYENLKSLEVAEN